MKASQGKANPAQVSALLQQEARLSSRRLEPAPCRQRRGLGALTAGVADGRGRRDRCAGSGPSEPGGAPAHSFFSRASSAS